MKNKGLIIGLFMMVCAILACPVTTLAYARTNVAEEATNVYIFGDSIMDGYMNNNHGIKYYLDLNIYAKKNNINVVSDYSKQGSTICKDMPEQVKGIVKDIKKHKGEKNVVIFDGGTNDIVKNCDGKHLKALKQLLKKIKRADKNVEFIVIIPDHISDYYAQNTTLADMYTALELLEDCKFYNTSRRINAANLQKDYMHIKAAGYRLVVSDLVRLIYEY